MGTLWVANEKDMANMDNMGNTDHCFLIRSIFLFLHNEYIDHSSGKY